MSSIPYNLQYFVESDRNNKYGWLALGLSLLCLVAYGVIFHWLQIFFRRQQQRTKWRFYFKLVRTWQFFNSSVPLPRVCTLFLSKRKKIYFQPSLLILLCAYLAINGSFMFVETKDLDYQDRYYIVGKRIGKVSTGNLPVLYIFAIKHDPIPFITGLTHDKINLLHRWMGRSIWTMILVHLIISIKYWLKEEFDIMLKIPPQYFGMIAFGSMTVLTWGSLRFFRRMSYEFFLFNHGLFAGIMMLFALFHNPASRAFVILGIHIIVLDRVIAFARAIINRYLSPTKSYAEASLLDDEGTTEVRLPLKKFKGMRWFVPNLGTWSVGQHVYLRVGEVRKVQWHPFTIASMPDSEELRLVIRAYNGFSKGIAEKIKTKLTENEGEETNVVKFLSLVHGPYGGRFLPLITFDTAVFISGGTGSSFTMPVALDLAQEIQRRNEAKDFTHRPETTKVRVIWYIQKKDSINWYSELVSQLASNGVQVDIFITREDPPDEVEEVEEKKPMNSEEHLFSTVSWSSSTRRSSTTSLSLKYERPNIRELIQDEAYEIDTKSMSLAVLACGPSTLVGEVQLEAQECRRAGKDVYSYIERYEV